MGKGLRVEWRAEEKQPRVWDAVTPTKSLGFIFVASAHCPKRAHSPLSRFLFPPSLRPETSRVASSFLLKRHFLKIVIKPNTQPALSSPFPAQLGGTSTSRVWGARPTRPDGRMDGQTDRRTPPERRLEREEARLLLAARAAGHRRLRAFPAAPTPHSRRAGSPSPPSWP